MGEECIAWDLYSGNRNSTFAPCPLQSSRSPYCPSSTASIIPRCLCLWWVCTGVRGDFTVSHGRTILSYCLFPPPPHHGTFHLQEIPFIKNRSHRIIEYIGLGGTSTDHLVHPCHGAQRRKCKAVWPVRAGLHLSYHTGIRGTCEDHHGLWSLNSSQTCSSLALAQACTGFGYVKVLVCQVRKAGCFLSNLTFSTVQAI